jgi:hypothetical protein
LTLSPIKVLLLIAQLSFLSAVQMEMMRMKKSLRKKKPKYLKPIQKNLPNL